MNTKTRMALMALIEFCSDKRERQDFVEMAYNGGLDPLPGKEERFEMYLDQPEETMVPEILLDFTDPSCHVFAAAHHMKKWVDENPLVFDQHETPCPVCQSKHFEGSSIQIEGSVATQVCVCLECDHIWTEYYQRVKTQEGDNQ